MVNTDRLHHVLSNPSEVHADDLPILETVIKEYPYFQAPRSVYLKGLHNAQSPSYNKELQVTAAHTADRAVLFDFITSDVFLQNRISEQIKAQQEQLENIEVVAEEIQIRTNDLNADTDFQKVTDVDLFEKKQPETTVDKKVLEFKKDEKYSFNQWLQLTSLKPIDRSNDLEPTTTSPPIEIDEEKLEKMRRIDEFLKAKPRITPRKSGIAELPQAYSTDGEKQLMTETLAKVYLAQKNYEKAIKSYEILILQHPEKSGFFADRIREIKNLQSNT
ncbi:hypothetical protein [Nonlabens agnitus]|uniref:Tetratricopeptide repeat protein n=1 Tax=Nonlabens agnitus TaxID=870484 RepID=A0A2S9WXL4_9FLAO|nr:hypothetical protein [Nonlabens agnitus]PRP68203.1 hypothetical protein BST86_14465 [Nonlabens agnitus]